MIGERGSVMRGRKGAGSRVQLAAGSTPSSCSKGLNGWPWLNVTCGDNVRGGEGNGDTQIDLYENTWQPTYLTTTLPRPPIVPNLSENTATTFH